jgi:hypothetical protein
MQAEKRNWQLMEFPHSPRTGVVGRPASSRHLGHHEPMVISGDDTTGRPANDNEKGTPWPLYDEYVAERLGKDAYTNSKNWNTAIWIDGIYRVAMLPERALGPVHWISNQLSNEEILDGYETTEAIPENALMMLNLLDAIDRFERQARKKTGQGEPVPIHEVRGDVDPRLPTGVEVRSDASKKLRLLQAGLRGLWKPVKQAVVDHTEMWTLGITQGVSRAMAPIEQKARTNRGLVIEGVGTKYDTILYHDRLGYVSIEPGSFEVSLNYEAPVQLWLSVSRIAR